MHPVNRIYDSYMKQDPVSDQFREMKKVWKGNSIMKKRKIGTIIISGLVAGTMLAGCGSSASTAASSASASSAASSAASETSSAAASSASEASSSADETAEAESVSAASGDVSTSSAKATGGSTEDLLTGTQFEGLKANKPYNFSVIVKSFQATYWQAALQGMDKAAEELGVTYDAQGPNTESDIADQVNMLNVAINGDFDGIALAASDTSSVIDPLQTAKDKGIPVVAFDTPIAEAPEGTLAATVSTDGEAAGATAAEHMYDALQDEIKNADGQVRIGEVDITNTATNIQQRGMGFINKIKELAEADGKTVAVTGNEWFVDNVSDNGDEGSADVIIEVGVPSQATVEQCATVASTIMSKDDCIGIYGSNQDTTEGILAANANLSVLGSDPTQDIIAVGFDAGSTIKTAVKDQTLYGAITQSPVVMGYYSIYALTAVANGQEVEDMPTAGYWYDSTNIDSDEIAPNLYD